MSKLTKLREGLPNLQVQVLVKAAPDTIHRAQIQTNEWNILM